MTTTTPSYTRQIVIIACLFFTLGFITWLNSVLIPFMKSVCELTESEAYLVASASYISFAVMALPSSYILNRVGYKKGMSLGLFLMAVGAVIFIPAATARSYSVFLLGIFVQGSGMTILQTSINPYITILGPIESGARRISIMGITNKLAGMAASVVFGSLLLSGISETQELLSHANPQEKANILNLSASKVYLPYTIMAISFLIISIAIRFVSLPELKNEKEDHKSFTADRTSILKYPYLILGVLALFFYVGAEVIAVDTIISYGISQQIVAETAKYFASATLVFMILGYILGILLIPKYLSQTKALVWSAVLGIVFSLGIIVTNGQLSILFVALLGLANALVWPAVWPLAIDGLGRHTKLGAALLIIGISGGAIIPPLYGHLVDSSTQDLIQTGIEQTTATAQANTQSYWILIPCYLYILYYAILGHKSGKSKPNF